MANIIAREIISINLNAETVSWTCDAADVKRHLHGYLDRHFTPS